MLLSQSATGGLRAAGRGRLCCQPPMLNPCAVTRRSGTSLLRFQTEQSPSWAPGHETIDERDRKKAVQIQQRFEDADTNK